MKEGGRQAGREERKRKEGRVRAKDCLFLMVGKMAMEGGREGQAEVGAVQSRMGGRTEGSGVNRAPKGFEYLGEALPCPLLPVASSFVWC